jgi:hypothetical protein
VSITTSHEERADAVGKLAAKTDEQLRDDLAYQRHLEANRRWRSLHAVELNERRRARLARDPGARRRLVATVKAWVAANPDRAAAGYASSLSNRRAARLGRPGRISIADVLALWARQPACVDCGQGRGLDHIVAMADGGPNVPANQFRQAFWEIFDHELTHIEVDAILPCSSGSFVRAYLDWQHEQERPEPTKLHPLATDEIADAIATANATSNDETDVRPPAEINVDELLGERDRAVEPEDPGGAG